MCVCVCVCERERVRKCVTHPVGWCGLDESGWIGCVYVSVSVSVCVCVICVCVRESVCANALHTLSGGAV